MSAEYPHSQNDFIDGSDAWRITFKRGLFQGVKCFTVWLHDAGLYNGGHPRWYDMSGDVHALSLRDDREVANIMLDLLDLGMVRASKATERLAVELLHHNGYLVPNHALIRIYGEGARQEESRE